MATQVSPMFQVGDKVVYPNHGVGIVDQIQTRKNGFMVERCYFLTIQSSSLKVMVPCQNADAVGLRRVVGTDEVKRIVGFLGDAHSVGTADWKERYREHCDKMKAGTLMEVAEVLKSLLVLHSKKPLCERELKMAERARHLLVNEIALATKSSEAAVATQLMEAIARTQLKFPEMVLED